MKRFLIVLLAAICFAACKKDDAVMQYYSAWGDLGSATTIYADNGILFRIGKFSSEKPIPEGQARIRFNCKILKKLADAEYEIELLDWGNVLKKNYVSSLDIQNDDALGHDAVYLNSAWFTGAYLNMTLTITYTMDSETKHLLNLVYDAEGSDSETLRFQLRHNGYGESFGENGVASIRDVAATNANVSIPFGDFIPKEGSVKVEIGWDWHVIDDEGYHPQTEHKTITGILYANN